MKAHLQKGKKNTPKKGGGGGTVLKLASVPSISTEKTNLFDLAPETGGKRTHGNKRGKEKKPKPRDERKVNGGDKLIDRMRSRKKKGVEGLRKN